MRISYWSSDVCSSDLPSSRPCSKRSAPMKVNVYVTLKPGVLDAQGKAIHHALEGLGFGGVSDVRAGRFIELDVADGTSEADLVAMCAKLLANPAIENYRIEQPGRH